MKIKTFFLGSVAAFVAVSGARAADAVVMVEPEPMEYVRVCDAYGAGFFYIPGTETCLKFSGYVRGTYTGKSMTTEVEKYTFSIDPDPTVTPTLLSRVSEKVKDSIGKASYRGRLNIDARSETEWGTLRSQVRFQGTGGTDVKEDLFGDGNALYHGGGNGNVEIVRALISLAGFRVGYSSDYWATVGDFGYFTAINDGIYSDGTATFADYTFSLNGFSLTVGAQTASGTRELNGKDYVSITGTGKKPDFYVGATYSGSWGNVFGTYYHDSSVKKGAYKVGAELSMDEYLPGTAIKGWYMDDKGETDYVGGHAWGVTAKVALSDSWSLYGGYSSHKLEGDDLLRHAKTSLADIQNVTVNMPVLGDAKDWTLGAKWEIVSGLSAYFEYNDRKTSESELTSLRQDGLVIENQDKKMKSYVVRLIRTF